MYKSNYLTKNNKNFHAKILIIKTETKTIVPLNFIKHNFIIKKICNITKL